ncbi:DEAD/DEAH box helicase [Streptomyces sp. 7N604]|uniref:DEAD/DEAH box helicase n=1 Tax=Streptomyces sp. 7N604 TaxID=3457415 RepID=UPI003FD18007
MIAISALASFGAPPELVAVWSQHVGDLTDVQERALRAGALDGRTNLLVVAPTSSGKTFVGELAATTSAYKQRQHAIFIVPFRALADEHYRLFRERYGHLLSVVISTSDWTEFDADIRVGNFNLAVMTYEKLMALSIQQPDVVERCTTLVVDEVQSLSDSSRGADLEVLLTRVMRAGDPPQIVALSGSLDDVNQLDVWLKATLVSSAERPIPLTQSVCAPSGEAIVLDADGTAHTQSLTASQEDRDALVLALAKQYVADGKQVIVFRSSVRDVVETARRLRGQLLAVGLGRRISEQFNELDDSDAINDLRLCLASGVAFHNADLTHPERSLVEDAFRSGETRVIVATTTLAVGVNLPTDIVIVADSTRFSPVPGGRWSRRNIPVSQYRNASGRAGRLGQRTAGSAVLVAEDTREQRQLVNAYLLGDVEPVESQLPKRPFADVIFDIVCVGAVDSEDDIVDFIATTYAYPSFYEGAGGFDAVRESIAAAVSRCTDSGLVVADGQQLYPTQLARVLGAAGLSMESAARLVPVLERAMSSHPSRKDLIFEIASCSEVGDRPWLQRQRGMELDPRPQHAPDSSGCSPGSRLAATLSKPHINVAEMCALVRTACLLQWMSGQGHRTISTAFPGMGAAAARVRALGKNAAWLLDALTEGARVHGASDALQEDLRALALEARYGLPARLAPLARLHVPGISREQMLTLYDITNDIGLHTPETILDTPDTAFDGLLTPLQLTRLRQAVLDDIEDSVRRKRAGHVARSAQVSLSRRLINDLYEAKGGGLEQAVTDALVHAGLSATRVLRQPEGEEDIQIAHADGTVVVSVTASKEDTRPIRWNKAKEILGAGVGLSPVNYVCIGRPNFQELAERNAANIARETASRSILLVPMPVFTEAVVRVAEGTMDAEKLGDLLAHRRGVLTVGDLSESAV